MRPKVAAPIAREEVGAVVVLTVALFGLAAALDLAPDSKRLNLPGSSHDALAVGVIPIVLACLVVFISHDPGVEIVIVTADRPQLAMLRIIGLCGLPVVVGLVELSLVVGPEGAALTLRNLAYGCAVAAAATTCVTRRAATSFALVLIVIMFFPGTGAWEDFASHPLHSFGVGHDLLATLGLWLAVPTLSWARVAIRRRWAE